MRVVSLTPALDRTSSPAKCAENVGFRPALSYPKGYRREGRGAVWNLFIIRGSDSLVSLPRRERNRESVKLYD